MKRHSPVANFSFSTQTIVCLDRFRTTRDAYALVPSESNRLAFLAAQAELAHHFEADASHNCL